MNTPDQTLCPIPDMGYCLYDRCPYWDVARQECDASCLQAPESRESGASDGPCTIYWHEDHD